VAEIRCFPPPSSSRGSLGPLVSVCFFYAPETLTTWYYTINQAPSSRMTLYSTPCFHLSEEFQECAIRVACFFFFLLSAVTCHYGGGLNESDNA